jgi:hypothetical protein
MSGDAAMTPDLLAAIGRALIAHCDGWARDPVDTWKVIRLRCDACAQLAVALGLDAPSAPGVQER